MTVKKAIDTMEVKRQKVAKVRDELREFLAEMEEIVCDCEMAEHDVREAKQALERAADQMSKYV